MTKTTIKQATEKWISEMNSYPQALLERAYPHMDGLEELTPLGKKWECDNCSEEFSKEEVEELVVKEHHDNSENIICPTCFKEEKEEFESQIDEEEDFTLEDCYSYVVEEEDHDNAEFGLPMWGWLWNPNFSGDEDWIKNNLEIVKDCGFRIYESDEIGVMIGIDGAGYDFYDAHWIPLYKARGLKWHSEELN